MGIFIIKLFKSQQNLNIIRDHCSEMLGEELSAVADEQECMYL